MGKSCNGSPNLACATPTGNDVPSPVPSTVLVAGQASGAPAAPGTSQASRYFCVMPFTHLHIQADGMTKACSKFLSNYATPDGQPLSANHDSLDAIWNSEELRAVRRDMAQGKPVSSCQLCYQEDEVGGLSYRTMYNRDYSAGWCNDGRLSLDQLGQQAAASDFRLPGTPASFQLDVGNLCNLKCRMCIGHYSSRIDQDAVHSRWAYAYPMKVFPRPDDVSVWFEYEGFYPAEQHGAAEVVWTKGEAAIRVLLEEKNQTVCLHLRVSAERPKGHRIRIAVDGAPVFDGVPEPGPWYGSFDIGPLLSGTSGEIRIASPTFRDAAGRAVGIGIEELELDWGSETTRAAAARVQTSGHWFREKRFLKEELLRDPSRLRHINFLGGEPLIIKEVGEFLQDLIDAGVSKNVSLTLTTNGTSVSAPWLKLTDRFRRVVFHLSVDGYGKHFEYIRYPAKWDTFLRNMEVLRALPNTDVLPAIAFQAYNMLNITDLLRFLDSVGLGFGYCILYFPAYLAAKSMPANARRLAAERLRAYADRDCRQVHRELVHGLASVLEPKKDEAVDLHLLRQFLLFTNDLDATRGQDMRTTDPELLGLIEEAGFAWSSETLHAGRRGLPMLAG